MNFDDYKAIDAVNWSTLKVMDESPAAYRHAMANRRPDSDTFRIGRYVHTLTLEPHREADRYAVWTGGRRTGAAWEAFLAAATADGREVLREQDIEESRAMAAALRSNRHVRAILDEAGAMFETPLVWIDPATGLLCKGLGDILCPGSRTLADLKTARSVDLRRFGPDIARLHYHGQMAHYEQGVYRSLGWVPRRVSLIVVEKAAPYDVAVFDLETDVRDAGAELVGRLLRELAECRASDVWPGRYVEPVTLNATNLPPWMFGGALPDMGFTQED